MADQNGYLMHTPKGGVWLVCAKLTGGGAGVAMTDDEAGTMGMGWVKSIVHASTGTFTLTFAKTYPELKCLNEPCVYGATAGLRARFTAIDVTAGTATLVTEVGATATDPATGDHVHISAWVRNTKAP